MRDDDIVITGAGVCCNMGDDLPRILAELRAGEPRARFEKWPPAVLHGARCQLIGLYHGDVSDAALGVSKAEGRFMGRQARLALKAARAALAESRIPTRELAVVVGSGTGDVEVQNEIHDKLAATKNASKISPTVIPRLMGSTTSANLVNVLRTTGPSFSVTAACSGGAYNILLAATLIRSGHATCALAGGAEVADLNFYAGFDAMGAYVRGSNDAPERASRPYAADRAGFVFAEGAGVVVLETRRAAAARGARALGTLAGWGMSSDGEGNMVAPTVAGPLAAMRKALEHAGVPAGRVGYVNTHGTSTLLGDVGEVRAIRELLGGRHVRYSSTKAYTGHTITATGAIEAIFTCAMVREGWVAPAIAATPLDPELEDYPPALAPASAPLEWALSNSFGFGGTNVTLVLGR